jgi:DNA-binding NtrC family response regulator
VLQDKAILIVEDNIFLAVDLSMAVEELEGRVVGPAVTAADAHRLLQSEQIAAVVLDCEIADHELTPIVMLLADKGIPVVLQAMSDPPQTIIEKLPDAPILRAPVQPKVILKVLSQVVANKSARTGQTGPRIIHPSWLALGREIK